MSYCRKMEEYDGKLTRIKERESVAELEEIIDVLARTYENDASLHSKLYEVNQQIGEFDRKIKELDGFIRDQWQVNDELEEKAKGQDVGVQEVEGVWQRRLDGYVDKIKRLRDD